MEIEDNMEIPTEHSEQEVSESKWTCRRCHHKSTTKGNLIKHLSRLTPCVDDYEKIAITEYIDELTRKPDMDKLYVCPYCPSKYTTRQARHKHKKTCSARPKDDGDNDQEQDEDNANMGLSREIEDKSHYQSVLEKHFKSFYKAILMSGTTDITTDDCHIEINEWESWMLAIAKLTIYNNDLQRDMLMACFYGNASNKTKSTAVMNMQKLGIQCLEFFEQDEDKRLCLKNMSTNEVIQLNYLEQ